MLHVHPYSDVIQPPVPIIIIRLVTLNERPIRVHSGEFGGTASPTPDLERRGLSLVS